MIKVGINGFGRIGRLTFRSIIERNNIEVVAINDLSDVDYLAYLLKYDSVHGRFQGDVEVKNGQLFVNGKSIRVTNEKNPENIKWNEVNVDYVIEATGLFLTEEKASLHLKGGAKKVVISASVKDENINMYVMGVNTSKMTADEKIFSNASCTTNCIAPVVKVLNDEFGLTEVMMTTVHASTINQSVSDGVNSSKRKGRAVLNNIIPTTTSSISSVQKVLPELKGKIEGMAIRVPVADVSLIDLTFKTEKNTNLKEILSKLKLASEGDLKGILGYTEDEVVSQDFVSETRISVVDAKASLELNNNLFKIIAWYDNEFGYATKIVDLVEYNAGL